MAARRIDSSPLEAPLGELERAFIEQFVRLRRYDPGDLTLLPEEERAHLLADASVYASGRLSEVEARSHYVDEMHPGASGPRKAAP